MSIIDSNISQHLNKIVELRDQKRRRTKYVTRTTKRTFYDVNFSLSFAYEYNINQI